ncbi:MAG: 3'-5' exonuclease [Planctomycetes bacterium]|nr:3'-5' exonuclease [Planctomycetota bacterium]
MMRAEDGIRGWELARTPVAVVDFETTGLNPGHDRVIEVSVVRIEPEGEQKLVFDTLVNPGRPVAATYIHGIADEDVRDAPNFEEIAGGLVGVLRGCVIAAYNVYFDMRFLRYELGRVGMECPVPHVCLMYMRPMLGLGSRCRLEEACELCGIQWGPSHQAAADALAAAKLWDVYLTAASQRRATTFGDIARFGSYKFVKSFQHLPFGYSAVEKLNSGGRLKSRWNRRWRGAGPIP